MSTRPSITPVQMIAALKRAGFQLHTKRGSHRTFKHPETKRRVTVPVHPRDLRPGTRKNILRQAGWTEDDFKSFL